MVLAAGFGTRLRPLTTRMPKPAVPVLGVPLVACVLAMLERAGIRHAVMNSHHLAAQLSTEVDAFTTSAEIEVELSYEPEILGTGGGLANAAASLAGADAIVLVNADTLIECDLAAVVAAHLDAGSAATLLLRANPDPRAYPPVETDHDLRVYRIAGNPPPAMTPAKTEAASLRPWLFTGIHILRPDVLELLPKGEASDVHRALHLQLIARGELVQGFLHTERWWDVGTPRRYLDANLESLDSPPEPLAELLVRRGLKLDGGNVTAEDAVIATGARVRRCVVASGCRIARDCSLERCILMPGAVVEDGASLSSCIIGPKVTIEAHMRLAERMVTVDGAVAIELS